MKKTVVLLTLALSISAFAQEVKEPVKVELNAEKISIDSNNVIVVRTNKTPEKVDITLRTPMANQVFERRVPTGKVCTRKNPHNEECLRWEETFRIETVRRERTCMVPETFCAQYGTANTFTSDNVKIQFKDLPALADSESETFSIAAKQKNYDSGDVVYEVKPLETLREYKVTQKKILFVKRDAFVVEEKK